MLGLTEAKDRESEIKRLQASWTDNDVNGMLASMEELASWTRNPRPTEP